MHLRGSYVISLKFTVAVVVLCALSIHCYSSLVKMIQVRLQKQKAPALVMNSYTNSAANCVRRL